MKARSARGSAHRLLAIALLGVSLESAIAQSQVVVQAITATPADSRPLAAREEQQQFDGAITQLLVFQGSDRTLRYSPPRDWLAASDSAKTVFTKGKLTATLSVRWTGFAAVAQIATPEQLQQLGQETFAKLRGAGAAPPATLLPWRVGELTFAESTVSSGLPGQARILQRVRSWGQDWQVQIELTGPEQEFSKLAPAFLDSIGSMQIRTTAELQAENAARAKEALAEAAPAPRRASSEAAAPGPKTRGQLR